MDWLWSATDHKHDSKAVISGKKIPFRAFWNEFYGKGGVAYDLLH